MRVALRVLALLMIPIGIASFVSVYADEPGLEGRAREVACAREGGHCHLRLARLARMPWKRSFVFVGSGGSVQVDCRHTLVLAGDYACTKSGSVDY